jgi:hypothetical protein
MIEKTLAMIAGLAPGTYVPDAEVCYDEDELKALAALLNQLIYAPSQLRRRLQDFGVSVVPANFYSEVPLIRDLEHSFTTDRVTGYDYIFDKDYLGSFLPQLTEYASEFRPPHQEEMPGRYFWENTMFSYSDAMAYYCVIRLVKPQRIVEVGSGYSTLVASEAVEKNGFGEIICVEPYPRDFLPGVRHVREILRRPVQDLGVAFFNQALQHNALFFIDSTHTVKHDSDCIHLICKILPKIQHKIHVHVHDVFLPNAMSLNRSRDEQLYWTEQYLIHAYLTDNRRTRVCYSSAYNYLHHRDALDAMMGGVYGSGGGSIWFEQSPP